MKEIVIFGSYCNTKEKLEALEKSINKAKSLNFDVLVFGRYPLPETTQKLCDYWIFDKSNPILADRALEHWLLSSGKRISNWFYDYGFAALEQIVKSLGFVKSLNYDIAYWLVYDVDLTNFSSFRDNCLEKIKEYNVVCHQFHPTSVGPPKGIDGTSVCFKVNESFDKLKGTITETFYRDLISRKSDFISEDFMEECFRVSELKYHILNPKPILPALLTSTGLRKHGNIPDEFIGIKKYFLNAFVGLDPKKNCQVLFIFNILKPFNKITYQVDSDIIYEETVNINLNNAVEINLFYAKFLKIISVDGEYIDETLDTEYSELYWNLNHIQDL